MTPSEPDLAALRTAIYGLISDRVTSNAPGDWMRFEADVNAVFDAALAANPRPDVGLDRQLSQLASLYADHLAHPEAHDPDDHCWDNLYELVAANPEPARDEYAGITNWPTPGDNDYSGPPRTVEDQLGALHHSPRCPAFWRCKKSVTGGGYPDTEQGRRDREADLAAHYEIYSGTAAEILDIARGISRDTVR